MSHSAPTAGAAEDPHRPLRDDVRRLGELLGQTLRTVEGPGLYDDVERVRALAKRDRSSGASGEALSAALASLPVARAVPIARAFAHFLHLANVAEQHHRIRRRRDYLQDPAATPQRGSCEEAFPRLVAAGVGADTLHQAVTTLQVELVLTAHPTEIARRTLIQKYNRMARVLDVRDRQDLTAAERDEIESTLLREVLSAWGTNEVRSERPTPLDEVRTSLVIFEDSLWDALPRFLRGVDRALRAATGRPLPVTSTPIRFGSWIGGDRDGNPSVTAEVTRRACLLPRWVAATLYLREVEGLRDELSLAVATPALRALAGPGREPYRELLRSVRARLRATIEWIEGSLAADADLPRSETLYLDHGDLAATLALCAESLDATGYGALAGGRLTDLRRRLNTFGMTLTRLDIRQDASRHGEALAAVLTAAGHADYASWNERDRTAFLTRELQTPTLAGLFAPDATSEAAEVLATFSMLAAIPRNSLGAYVITMASKPSDVLTVMLLQRLAGLTEPLRVVPLFETSRDLEASGRTLDALFAMDWYRDRNGGQQEVMIGYSDSAKDVGRFAAAWDLYEAQEEIVTTGRRHGVRVTLFHGRGGSAGRGGGPTHLAIMSQPPGSIDGSLRVTEQGEMLQALFGLPDIAVRTLDVYTTATLEAWLLPPPPPRAEWRALMDELRDAAKAQFRATVYEDPRFVDYFRHATPEAELGDMNIGSRPARRKPTTGVESLRAIPWQFAWTQTRLLLGAWLGIEAALGQAIEGGRLEDLRAMYRDWPVFRSVIDLTEMVLAKAEERIAAEYDRRLVPDSLQPVGAGLRARLGQASDAVLQVTGHRELLESNPVLRRSIDVRNPYVDPINLLQVELLARLRQSQEPDEELRAALHLTINGIAAGMRNTG
jgi:phosphoenolpyruvate carboxylase